MNTCCYCLVNIHGRKLPGYHASGCHKFTIYSESNKRDILVCQRRLIFLVIVLLLGEL